jgi:hypothetical protein
VNLCSALTQKQHYHFAPQQTGMSLVGRLPRQNSNNKIQGAQAANGTIETTCSAAANYERTLLICEYLYRPISFL